MWKKSKVRKLIIFGFICSLLLFYIPSGKGYAEIADGTYSIQYEIIHAETESASIANDYFEKPAILSVIDGKRYVRFTVNHSAWIQTIQTFDGENDYIDVDVKEEDQEEDMRDVVFELASDDLNEPWPFKMHVVIDEIEPQIDSHYTARFAFQPDSMEPLEDSDFEESDLIFEGPSTQSEEQEQEDTAGKGSNDQQAVDSNSEGQVEQPEPSSLNIWMVAIIFLIIAAGAVLMLVRNKRK